MPGVLERAADTVAFPDLERFGWRPIGARSDDVAGRAAVTVYYARDGRQLRYTIVAGAGDVAETTGTTEQPVTYERRTMSFVTGIAGTTTLVLKRTGRTVVLSAPGARRQAAARRCCGSRATGPAAAWPSRASGERSAERGEAPVDSGASPLHLSLDIADCC